MGATLLHSGPFSVLWSFLGHDAAMRLVEEEMMKNVALQCGLVGAAVVGLVVSPVSMAWWINDMRNNTGGSSSAKKKEMTTTRRERKAVKKNVTADEVRLAIIAKLSLTR